MKAVILGWKRNNLNEYLNDCETISYNLAKSGYSIYTGAGDGFMKAANDGANKFDKKKSFGVLPECIKDQLNEDIVSENVIITKNFNDRKIELIKDYDIMIFFPGGIGTLDEFTEVMNLIKTKELEFKEIYLYGFKYWNSLKSWFNFNNQSFPDEYITGIIDSIDEFDNLHETNNSINNSKSENESTIEEIKEYEPIFTKKTIFNPFDDIDNLIENIFNDPDMLKNFDFKTGKALENKEESNNEKSKSADEISEEMKMDNDSLDDDDIIIEIIYESESSENSQSNNSNEENDAIDPIDFITDTESDTNSNDN